MKAPKRRSFWQYNKDNKYWVIWLVAATLGGASVQESSVAFFSFIGVGVVTVIVGLIDWKRLG